MIDKLDLILILPEIILALLGLVILMVDVFYLRRKYADGVVRSGKLGYTILGTLVGISVLSYLLGPRSFLPIRWPGIFGDFFANLARHGSVAFGGAFLVDGITLFFRVIFLLVAALVLLLSLDREWGRHEGEYYALLTLSVLGMSVMAAAGELVTIYIALELTSISLYLLTAFDFRRRSLEGGLKYFIFGGFSSAILLYGLSLLYGFTGTTSLQGIAHEIALRGGGQMLNNMLQPDNYGLLLGIAFLVAGFGFKLALVPFHAWTPDVYEGAPTPIAAFISTGSKAASFVVVTRIFHVALQEVSGTLEWGQWETWGWAGLLAMLAVVTFTVANLMALPQRNVKRLLAYSSIAHAGYMLIGVLLNTRAGVEALFYYIFAYVLTNVGAFATVIAVSRFTGGENIEDFAGLSKRSLPLAGALTVLFFSLAGVPPLAGFFAKFWLFWATFERGLIWLAVVGLLNTIIAFFYYLRVLKAVWFDPPTEDTPVVVSDSVFVVLLATVFLVIFVGILPQVWLRFLQGAVQALFG